MKVFLVTSNLIERKGKFLLVQEGHQYAYGLWNFPSGKLEDGLTLAENAVKEAREETGYRVKVKGLVGIYQTINGEKGANVVRFLFASSIVGGKMLSKFPPDEIIQAKWFTFKEIKKIKNKLRDKYIITAIDDYKKKGALPLGIIKSR